jgi:hypothetical protein
MTKLSYRQMRQVKLAMFRMGEVPITDAIKLTWPNDILDDFQVDIIASMMRGKGSDLNELFIKGCTKAGKGAAVAKGACLWLDEADEAKVILNSSSWQHAKEVMFPEVASWWKKIEGGGSGNALTTGISSTDHKYCTISNPQTGEGFSGHHGPFTLFIFDEASGTQQIFYDLAATQSHMIIALSNPRTLGGWFRSGFPKDDMDATRTIKIPGGRRRLITIGAPDCMNVRLGKEVIPNQIDRARYEMICSKGDFFKQVFGLGKFPTEDPEKQVVFSKWLQLSYEHWKTIDWEEEKIRAYGLDVARSLDGDQSILSAGNKKGCSYQKAFQLPDTTQLIAEVMLQSKRDGCHSLFVRKKIPICVDMDGIGAGVGDRLEELGCWVIQNFGNKTAEDVPEQHENQRTENYALLGKALNPSIYEDHPFAIPQEDWLWEDLVAQEKVFKSDAFRFGLLPKDKPIEDPEDTGKKKGERTIREKIGRSPDRGDSMVYLHRATRYLPNESVWNSKTFTDKDEVRDLNEMIDQQMRELMR